MALKLYFHPLSSYCHKALTALYELGTAFEPVLIDLGDATSRAKLEAVWPMIKFPVLRDEARDCNVAESTVVIEYLDMFHPGADRLIPAEPDLQWQCRMWDRVFDHYVNDPMAKIVADALRPAGQGDARGVEDARALLGRSCDLLEDSLGGQEWAVGDTFTLADCAAAPALFYANTIMPFGPARPRLAGYLRRLMERPSYARVLLEAEPYFNLFPLEPKPRREPATESSPA